MSNNYIDPWGTNTTGVQARQTTVHAYWIHEKIKVKQSVTGYYYLPDCSCSNCGHYSRRELPVCGHCKAVMDAKPKK
jgi:hypothetical protein